MNKELYFIGEPFQFKPGILIYPPKVKDVITNQYYGHFGKLLTQSQEDIEDRFIEEKNPQEVYPTPFEALLNNCYNHKGLFSSIYQQIYKMLLRIIIFMPKQSYYGKQISKDRIRSLYGCSSCGRHGFHDHSP